MIFDGENLFFDKAALSAATLTSDVLSVGIGEAGDPLQLIVRATDTTGTGKLTVKVETSASDAFTTSTQLAEYVGTSISARIPRGNLGFLRLKVVSTYTAGKLTAGITVDDDIPW